MGPQSSMTPSCTVMFVLLLVFFPDGQEAAPKKFLIDTQDDGGLQDYHGNIHSSGFAANNNINNNFDYGGNINGGGASSSGENGIGGGGAASGNGGSGAGGGINSVGNGNSNSVINDYNGDIISSGFSASNNINNND